MAEKEEMAFKGRKKQAERDRTKGREQRKKTRVVPVLGSSSRLSKSTLKTSGRCGLGYLRQLASDMSHASQGGFDTTVYEEEERRQGNETSGYSECR